MDSITYLNELRLHELNAVINATGLAVNGLRVLEIGSGTGKQMAELLNRGAIAVGVEIENAWYEYDRNTGIITYDGRLLPFEDETFDVVYSSNVLEHISDFEGMQSEIHRVLKRNGRSIHLMPSCSWRLWAILIHYVDIWPRIIRYAYNIIFQDSRNKILPHSPKVTQTTFRDRFANIIFPRRHGEFGNRFTEHCEFRRKSWINRFESAGWTNIKSGPIEIFYTYRKLIGRNLSFDNRKRLSRVFGSSANYYEMTCTKE